MQADKINTLIKAANVPDVEPIWATLFAKALEGKDVKDMLLNVGSGGGAAAAPTSGGGAAASGGGGAAAAEEEKEEEKKEEGMFLDNEGLNSTRRGVSLTQCATLQRRKNPTRTWVSVSSTKHSLHLNFCTLAPRFLRYDVLESSSVLSRRCWLVLSLTDEIDKKKNSPGSGKHGCEWIERLRTVAWKKATVAICGLSKSHRETSVRDELWPAKTHADLSEPTTAILENLIPPKCQRLAD